MAEEFEGDLAGAVFWGADLSGATFRDVNLTDAAISHAWLVNVTVDALVDNVVINGVDVTAFVNEHDPWYPLRTMLRPATSADMRATLIALDAAWATTAARADALTEELRLTSVDGEWSFVDTLRHMVFAIDKWFTAAVLGDGFHPIGLPNRGSLDFPWPGLDLQRTPSYVEALAVYLDRMTRVHAFVSPDMSHDFERGFEVLENGEHPLRECLYTVFEESFWHNRYAARDLALLEAGAPPQAS